MKEFWEKLSFGLKQLCEKAISKDATLYHTGTNLRAT